MMKEGESKVVTLCSLLFRFHCLAVMLLSLLEGS